MAFASSAESTHHWAADPPTHLAPDEVVAEIPTTFVRAKAGSQPSISRSVTPSIITSAPRPTPVPPSAEAPAPTLPPFVQLPNGASFDPLAIPLPQELAPSIYGWIRRLALQADLAGADRLLRDAVVDLTSALSVLVIYSGPDGLHTLGIDDELPKDPEPVVAVAKARRAVVMSHSALLPICTANECVAVIQIERNSRQPAFGPPEYVAMAAIGRECAGVIHHLVVQHLQRSAERKADKGSLYRPEALESHRTRGQEGVLADLSPVWVKRAYPMIIATIIAAVVLGIFLHVPTYSSGTGIVVFDGKQVTAPQSGTVDVVAVEPGDHVHKGQLLVKLRSEDVEAGLRQANKELEAAIQQYLFDSADEQLRKTLISAETAARRAQASVDQRSVRAEQDGTVSDIRVRLGQLLQPGSHILTLVDPHTKPEVWAFLPGSDRPRLHEGQELQVELVGFTKARDLAKITQVGREVIGAGAARRYLGDEIADGAKLAEGSYVLVKAQLPSPKFKAKGKEMWFYTGLTVKTEVRVERKRFIVTLLPSLEKYVD